MGTIKQDIVTSANWISKIGELRTLRVTEVAMLIFAVGLTILSFVPWRIERTDQHWLEDKTAARVNAVRNSIVAHMTDVEDRTIDDEALLRRMIAKCRSELDGTNGLTFKDDGTILDLWGRPLRIQIIDRNPDRPKIKVWSTGRNGIDENGKGDDIVSQD